MRVEEAGLVVGVRAPGHEPDQVAVAGNRRKRALERGVIHEDICEARSWWITPKTVASIGARRSASTATTLVPAVARLIARLELLIVFPSPRIALVIRIVRGKLPADPAVARFPTKHVVGVPGLLRKWAAAGEVFVNLLPVHPRHAGKHRKAGHVEQFVLAIDARVELFEPERHADAEQQRRKEGDEDADHEAWW